MNDNDNPLPDTKKWQPRKNASETLKSAFLKRCIALENLIQTRAVHEQEMNIDNYDSGPSIEDI
jgi:hypothetical protein